MDFAPYQSSPPEHSRPFSPAQSPSPRVSYERQRSALASPPPLQHPQPQRQWAPTLPGGYSPVGSGAGGVGGGHGNEAGYGVDAFDTSLGVRLDYEAAASYLAIPPLGAIVLLILERKSDYVRREMSMGKAVIDRHGMPGETMALGRYELALAPATRSTCPRILADQS
ncbi:UPF0132 domain protein [Seiridium cupressi]